MFSYVICCPELNKSFHEYPNGIIRVEIRFQEVNE